MVLTTSTMLPLGSKAPDFTLPDTTGKMVSLSDFSSAPALVVIFMCNHCPYVKHIRDTLAKLAQEFQQQNVAVVAINANNIETHPDDSPDQMAIEAKEAGYTFPYLFDETQEVAKAYKAACTPDFFVFNECKELAYRGQLDDSRPGNDKPVTGASLKEAVACVLQGQDAPLVQKPSSGCNIKWKPGNEPDYF
jgi:peroxiredoxin